MRKSLSSFCVRSDNQRPLIDDLKALSLGVTRLSPTNYINYSQTLFTARWRYHDNLQAVNGSMNWQEDYLAFSLLADYLFQPNEFYGEISALVNSTIPTLPRAAAVAKHRSVWKKSADTLLKFQVSYKFLLLALDHRSPMWSKNVGTLKVERILAPNLEHIVWRLAIGKIT